MMRPHKYEREMQERIADTINRFVDGNVEFFDNRIVIETQWTTLEEIYELAGVADTDSVTIEPEYEDEGRLGIRCWLKVTLKNPSMDALLAQAE